MINSLHIDGVATCHGIKIDGLKQVNYFFGANGTGKTTIGRVLRALSGRNGYGDGDYRTCGIEWSGRSPCEVFVYNQDFVNENFWQSPTIPGVFTVGKENVEAKKECDEIEHEKIPEVEKQLASKTEDIASLQSHYDNERKKSWDILWACKKSMENASSIFRQVFSGLHNNMEAFWNEVMQHADTTVTDGMSRESLIQEAEKYFAKDIPTNTQSINIRKDLIESILSYENDSIWGKFIVGTQESNIGNFIQQLGNSDWIHQGLPYLTTAQHQCPFCQQTISDELISKIKGCFDKTYQQDKSRIQTLVGDYGNTGRQLLAWLKSLPDQSSFLEEKEWNDLLKLLETQIGLNESQCKEKQDKPSKEIILKSSQDILDNIRNLIESANKKAEEYLKKINDEKNTQQAIRDQAFRYVYLQNETHIGQYQAEKKKCERLIANIESEISELEPENEKLKKRANELRSQITDVHLAAEEINNIMRHFCIVGFQLTVTDDNHYQLVRSDGSPVENTLSEGEKTLVTFLYFYQSIMGSIGSPQKRTLDRVIVFDDPVSSLDSNILFLVRHLIGEIAEKVKKDQSNTKQLIVLTHNIYFYKELTVTNISDPKPGKKTAYWIVRKNGGCTSVELSEKPPITTYYANLWSEIRSYAKDSSLISSMTLQNILRRIVEHYFHIVGGWKEEKIMEKVPKEHREACLSLTQWMNSGSHALADDMYCDTLSDAQAYLNAFKNLFDVSGHLEHYKMMMCEGEDAEDSKSS